MSSSFSHQRTKKPSINQYTHPNPKIAALRIILPQDLPHPTESGIFENTGDLINTPLYWYEQPLLHPDKQFERLPAVINKDLEPKLDGLGLQEIILDINYKNTMIEKYLRTTKPYRFDVASLIKYQWEIIKACEIGVRYFQLFKDPTDPKDKMDTLLEQHKQFANILTNLIEICGKPKDSKDHQRINAWLEDLQNLLDCIRNKQTYFNKAMKALQLN